MRKNAYILITWTSSSKEEANQIVTDLLHKRWIACGNILSSPLDSIYLWKGKVVQDREYKVLLKTKSSLFFSICNWIQEKSSYEISEILSFPIAEGNPAYLAWIDESIEEK